MPVCTTSQVPEIGSVDFALSKRAKYLRITITHDGKIRLTIPSGMPMKKAQQFLSSKIPWIKKHLRHLKELENTEKNTPPPKINKLQARAALIKRLAELRDLHGFKYNKVTIRNQKSKWGSCSSKNNISLNINLIRLPTELMDYVILHELLHTRIKQHGKKFWTELDKYTDFSAKELNKRLKKHQLGTLSRATNKQL